MAWTSSLRVTIGNPTKKTDLDNVAINAEFLQELAANDHDFDVSTGTGKHKTINMLADGTYDVATSAARARNIYANRIGDSGKVLVLNASCNVTGSLAVGLSTFLPTFPFSVVASKDSQYVARFRNNSSSTPHLFNLNFGTTPNNATSIGLLVTDTTADRLKIWSNGNVVNANNSYGAISARELKQDITPARKYWTDFKKVPFYKYRTKTDVTLNASAPYQLGTIADEVEPIFPRIVEYGLENAELAVGEPRRLPSVKYSVLGVIGLRVIQELQTRVENIELALNITAT